MFAVLALYCLHYAATARIVLAHPFCYNNRERFTQVTGTYGCWTTEYEICAELFMQQIFLKDNFSFEWITKPFNIF